MITNLHPEHESHLAELLQRHTSMPTMQGQERVKVEGNHVYVIPSNRSIIRTYTHLPTGQSRNFLASVQYLKLDGTNTLVSAFIDITERQVRSLASDLTAAEQEERKRISQIPHYDLQQRHHLSLMGCQMQIQSGPDKGTQVIIDIPNQQVK